MAFTEYLHGSYKFCESQRFYIAKNLWVAKYFRLGVHITKHVSGSGIRGVAGLGDFGKNQRSNSENTKVSDGRESKCPHQPYPERVKNSSFNFPNSTLAVMSMFIGVMLTFRSTFRA